eukprot:TRINITY_DN1607_c0_g1_i4.p1 TRINITY_DN1607_c0_g1~~TRINITY_DN1607_c0_g1_i4.p1  ORF type:complete len:119 (-),score=30.71 TRINITY_DN1607_c0_g1_i4:68-424(-)
MSHNQLSCIEDILPSAAEFDQLEVINMSHNVFTQLPQGFEHMCCLDEIDASFNQITEIPESIIALADKLQILQLTNNQISHLPDGISQLESLRVLNMSFNQLVGWPECINQLYGIEEM